MGCPFNHAEINFIFQDAALNPLGIPDQSLHLKLWKQLPHSVHAAGQQIRADGDAGPHLQGTLSIPVSHRRLHLIHQGYDMAAVLENPLSLFR